MRLVHKIAVILILAATAPLASAGFFLVARNEQALESEVRDRFDQTARHAATVVASDVEGRARQLAHTAAMIQWDRLDTAEAAGALALLRRQARAAAALVYDEGLRLRARNAVTPESAGDGDGDGASAEARDDELDRRAPKRRALDEGAGAVVFSAPYRGPLGVTLAAALAVRGGVLALALPLANLGRRLDEARGDQPVTLTLVDSAGQVIADGGGAAAPPPEAIADALAGRDGHARRYAHPGGARVVAFAPVGGLGWSLVVAEPVATAFAAARALRVRTLLGTGAAALIALLAALGLARRLTGALAELSAAARALGAGDFDIRVTPTRDDELGALACAFNAMGEELARRRVEIERWGRELEERVVERTAELRQTQAQLLQTQKLAAVGQLGAGVAHEINNPLAGVLGHVQLLLAARAPGDEDWGPLRSIEEGARRAAQVVHNLQRFSVQQRQPVRGLVDVSRLVRDTLSLTESLIRDQHIALGLELGEPAPCVRGDAGQLAQVLLNLVANARTAMPGGGELRVRVRQQDDVVMLAVIDSGRGIAPDIRERIFEPFFTTKHEWSNVGLGLSVSYRIVEEHEGHIVVESQVGLGSTFTVYLPAA